EKDDLLGSEARENRVADDSLVGGGVETREIPVEAMAIRTDVRELLALGDLKGVERRKCLELDQSRDEPAGLLSHREVRHGEDGQVVAARHVETLRHGRERPLERRRGGELTEDLERGRLQALDRRVLSRPAASSLRGGDIAVVVQMFGSPMNTVVFPVSAS